MRRPFLIALLVTGVVAGYGSAFARMRHRGGGGHCGWKQRANVEAQHRQAGAVSADTVRANEAATRALSGATVALEQARLSLVEATSQKETVSPSAPSPELAALQAQTQLQAQALTMAQAQVQALTQALAQSQARALAEPRN